MSVVLRIASLDLPQSVVHKATDWQVSTDLLFSNIILQSNQDEVNKTKIVFNESLDPTIKYYARARSLLDPTGYTIWGNIDIFTPVDVNDTNLDQDIPSLLSVPKITTNYLQNEHSSTFFKIFATGFSSVGNATHTDTTWVIEDINGDVVWSSIRDNENKTSISVNDLVLKQDNCYNIKVLFNSTSNDVSQTGTHTIVVGNNKYTKLLSNTHNLNIGIDNTLVFAEFYGITYMELEILNVRVNSVERVFNILSETETKQITIPAFTLKQNEQYIVKAKTNLDTTHTVYNLSTY